MFGSAVFIMRFILTWALLGFTGAFGCSDGDGTAAPSGEALYSERHSDGNTFACATCHALQEPASDGIRRPGRSIGDANERNLPRDDFRTKLGKNPAKTTGRTASPILIPTSLPA